jgi:hypothetical protein
MALDLEAAKALGLEMPTCIPLAAVKVIEWHVCEGSF